MSWTWCSSGRSRPMSTCGATSTASRPARAARTRTVSAAGIGKAVRNFIDTHNLSPKGVTLTADDIREGMVAVLSMFIKEPQFQGQTKDRLNNPEVAGDRRLEGPACAGALAEPQHSDGRSDRRARSFSPRARARPVAPRSRKWRVRARRRRADPARQAQRLHHLRPRRERDLHRRGRLGRRVGEAGPRSRATGHPAAAGQGAQHRERVDRQGAREQGTVRSRHRARVRHGQGLRHRRSSATAASSSWPTRTPTAITSPRC